MKKKLITIALLCLVMFSPALLVACGGDTGNGGGSESPSTGDNSANSEAYVPSLMPADHEGRFEQGGGDNCYTCHGASDQGNPTLESATAIPEDHYVDGSYSTQQLAIGYNQCITCHVIDERG